MKFNTKFCKFILLIIFSYLNNNLYSQDEINALTKLFIEGQITDKENHESLPFVNIFNKATKKGTTSIIDGHFRIYLNHYTDTILFSYVGYKTKKLLFNPKSKFVNLELEQSATLLNEITVFSEDSYLYNLISECKKNISKYKTQAKMYYQLETLVDDKQAELIECYYNGSISGYNLEDLHIKNGRIAMKRIGEKFITSPESSIVISILKLFQKNEHFPQNPFSISSRKLKKYYNLELSKKINDENGNTIDIIEFKPKNNSEDLFSGQAWINTTHKKLIKINLQSHNTKTQPFKLISSYDVLQSVDFNISMSFKEYKENMVFNHIDFNYSIQHKTKQNQMSVIYTQAFLQAYDYENVFQLPRFNFSEDPLGDYRKINAIPYNELFWETTNEFKILDRKDKNKLFFTHEAEITNKSLFKTNFLMKGGFLEYPYIIWNGDRTWFRSFDSDSINEAQNKGFTSSLYKLNVKLFADLYTINDSIQLISATELDPVESYYKLNRNRTALCFINIYFDLMELQRREFEREFINSDRSRLTFDSLYNSRLKKMEAVSNTYFKEVQHGTNGKELLKWNKTVLEELGINNFKIFLQTF